MTDSHPRHRQDAGYACGAETRQRIIDAAIRLFGARGFDGASTREIGRLAGINAPALRYYFDSKEGLYLACAEHISAQTRSMLGPALQAGRDALAAGAPAETLAARFLAIIEVSADLWLVTDGSPHRRMFLAQEQAGYGPGGEFSDALQAFRAEMGVVIGGLIAGITDRAADDTITRIRIMTLYGQLMVFHVVQRSVLTTLQWERIDAERLAQIKTILRSQSLVLMDAWRSEAGLPPLERALV